MFKVWSPQIINLGDFFNIFPVLSGIAKATEPLKLVVPPNFRQFNGFREFLEFQPFVHELFFQDEIMNMDQSSYMIVTYSPEEYKSLVKRPNRPIETMRAELFVRHSYPDFKFDVDDDFTLQVSYEDYKRDTYIVGDRWSQVIDSRRDFNILKNSGLFENPFVFEFLDYSKPLMDNAALILSSNKPFIGTFTGSGMLADLLKKENWCVYDDSMLPLWNEMPIEYSYWKHYYSNRPNKLMHIDDVSLKDLS